MTVAAPPPRILFIGKRFYTNKDALAERFGRVYRLPAAWAAQGVDARLWLVDYHTREAVERRDCGLPILSTPVPGLAFLRAAWAAWRARPTVVVGAGDCYVGLLAWALARLRGARFVFDIYDKYDEFAGYRRLPFFDPFTFLRRRADLRLYCSRGLQALHAGEPGPSAFVANGVDEREFAPADRDACRARLALPAADVLVGYFGSMEPDRGVADLLEAMARVRASGRAATLLLCGRAEPGLSLDGEGILFRGLVPHADMPCYLNACDLLAIPYRESAIMDMGASCKIAEYLMVRRPLVSTRTANFTANFPAQAAELDDQLVPSRDPAALAQAIARQLDDRRLATRPLHMAWPGIAADALQAIRALEPANG